MSDKDKGIKYLSCYLCRTKTFKREERLTTLTLLSRNHVINVNVVIGGNRHAKFQTLLLYLTMILLSNHGAKQLINLPPVNPLTPQPIEYTLKTSEQA